MAGAGDNIEDQFTVAKKQVTEWLMADSWKIQAGAGDSKTAWVVIAEDHQKKKVVFAQLNESPDVILLRASLNISPDILLQVSNLDPAKRAEILWEIRFQLLNMGLKFSGVNPKLEIVQIDTRLYLEDLTRNEFARTVGNIQDSILAILWVIRKHLGQPEPPEELSKHVM